MSIKVLTSSEVRVTETEHGPTVYCSGYTFQVMPEGTVVCVGAPILSPVPSKRVMRIVNNAIRRLRPTEV
jgi:hypothetical protein